jgi:hypothetical protein
MIKTLRITSVVAVVLAIALIVSFVVFGVHSDEQVKAFLSSPGILNRHNSAANNKTPDNQTSLLVQQAQVFSSILKPPQKAQASPQTGRNTPTVIPEPDVTPKFKIIATCYYEQYPELSIALINEPGRGQHWVRESSMVGHLLIAQIQDGLVVVKNDNNTFELKAEQKSQPSPAPAAANVPGRSGGSAGVRPPSAATAGAAARKPAIPAAPAAKPQLPSAEKNAEVEATIQKLKEIDKSSKSGKTDPALSETEKTEQINKLISTLRASHVDEEEAKKLDDLGEELKNVQNDPNLAVSPTDVRITQPDVPKPK